jgi:hypothetical protein
MSVARQVQSLISRRWLRCEVSLSSYSSMHILTDTINITKPDIDFQPAILLTLISKLDANLECHLKIRLVLVALVALVALVTWVALMGTTPHVFVCDLRLSRQAVS